MRSLAIMAALAVITACADKDAESTENLLPAWDVTAIPGDSIDCEDDDERQGCQVKVESADGAHVDLHSKIPAQQQ